jgi:hypothetical protein
VTARGTSLVSWPGAHLVETVQVDRGLAAPIRAGARVGALTVVLGNERASVPLVAARSLAPASVSWRLGRL